jgi:hypothetical protein
MKGFPRYTRFYNYPEYDITIISEYEGKTIQMSISQNKKMMSDSPAYQRYSQFLTGPHKPVRLIANNWEE